MTGNMTAMNDLNSRFRNVLEFDTIVSGYDHCRAHGAAPFIVRNCPEFIPATHSKICNQIKLETSLHGYNSSGTRKVTGRQALEQWSDDSLDFNVVDSSSTRGSALMPQILKDLNIANDVEIEVWFAYVLTLGAVQSKVHIDPPFGSGWQYLSCGSKVWTIVDAAFFASKTAAIIHEDIALDVVAEAPAALPLVVSFDVLPIQQVVATKTARFSVLSLCKAVEEHVVVPIVAAAPIVTAVTAAVVMAEVVAVAAEIAAVDEPHRCMPASVGDSEVNGEDDKSTSCSDDVVQRKLFPTEYRSRTDYDLDGMSQEYPHEFYRVVLNAGDFLSCPLDWPHAVYTVDKACGLSGYMKYTNPPGGKGDVEKAVDEL